MSDSSYLVLARKYRPQNFDQLIGQSVLVTTLSNAIKNNRLHHAYILTGIRGVGKTTTARIIAKTINCLNRDNNSTKSCDICNNCKLIASSKHQDVIEIDAASRTGVDDIREIIDSVAYAPVLAKNKIYIIDEVHMLSNSAFNALLKTLEEPPPHVKFIFATTEIKKVPITILSRCQRFDLRRLDEKEIVNHLKKILETEKIEAEERALDLIAKMSEGSVRDSLSLLDQAFANNDHQKFLATEIVEKMLGIGSKSKTISLFESLLEGNFIKSLQIFSEFYSHSSDILQLTNDLLEITHKTTSAKLITNYELGEYSESEQKKIRELSEKLSLNSIMRIWQMLLRGISEVNLSKSPKITFEMLMIRICHLIALPNLQKILLGDGQEKPSLATNYSTPEKNINESGNDVVNDILRSFEGSQLI